MSRNQGLIGILVALFLGFLAWNSLGGASLHGAIAALYILFIYALM